MLRMKNPIAVPDRCFYDIEGHRLQHPEASVLYAMCVAEGEKLNYQDWHELLIHKMCLELPPGTCFGDTDGDEYVKRLTWKDIKGFLAAITAVAKTALSGERVYVDQSEADRRAFLCKTCQRNARVHCGGCMGIIMLANLFLHGRTVEDQGDLGACTLCGCWIAAKVWCSKDVLKRVIKEDIKYPDNCWNKEIL